MRKSGKKPLEYLSGRELARRLGVSETAVRKAEESGRIEAAKINSNGQRLYLEDAVRKQWRLRTLPQAATMRPKVKAVRNNQEGDPDDADFDAAPLKGRRVNPVDARAMRDAAQAELTIIKTKKEKNELVKVVEVAKAWENHVATAKRLFLALPVEFRMHIPALTADNVQMIEERIFAVLDTLSAWNPENGSGA